MNIFCVLYSLNKRIAIYKRIVYSFYLKHMLGSVGNSVYFDYPCRLEGGGWNNIKIGNNSVINKYCVLGAWKRFGKQCFHPFIEIGENCNIGEYCHITAINKIAIGNGLLTGRFVYIGDNSHGGLSLAESTIPPIKRDLISKGPTVIGNNVWIGDRVCIWGE